MTTYAPADLMVVRAYANQQTGLDYASLGITGDPAHISSGGYHEGRSDLASVGRLYTDYSVRESQRDRNGLTDAASAFDLGSFSRLQEISRSMVSLATQGHPTMQDVREIIYSPDGVNVRRWDALGIRDYGDSSHLWHTHFSFFRDSEGRRHFSNNFLGALRWAFEGTPLPTISSDGDDMTVAGPFTIPEGFAEHDLIGDPDSVSGTGKMWDPTKISYAMIPSLLYDKPGQKAYIRFGGELPGATRQTARLRVATRIDGGGGWDVRIFDYNSRLAPNQNSFQLPGNATFVEIIRQPMDEKDPGVLPISWNVAYYA